jgi:hypothetical protein
MRLIKPLSVRNILVIRFLNYWADLQKIFGLSAQEMELNSQKLLAYLA